MKYILLSIFLVLLVLFWYTRRTSLEDRFNKLKRADYSIFNDIEIVHREGLYYITYKSITYKVNRGVFITESLSIEYAYSDNKALELTEYDKEKLKKVICAFNNLDVLAVTVDRENNLYLTLPWDDRCTYYFIRLSGKNTLKQINKDYYQHYVENWYYDKECSESG